MLKIVISIVTPLLILTISSCDGRTLKNIKSWDKEKPNLTILTPKNNTIYGNNKIVINGVASASNGLKMVEVAIDNNKFYYAGGENWAYEVDAKSISKEGKHTVCVRAMDMKGNVEIKNISIIVDRKLPDFKVIGLPWQITNSKNINISIVDNNKDIVEYEYEISGETFYKGTNDITAPIQKQIPFEGKYSIAITVRNNVGVEKNFFYAWEVNEASTEMFFKINNNDTYTFSTKVDLNINIDTQKIDTDNILMSFSNDKKKWSEWRAYSNIIKDWELSSEHFSNTVYGRFKLDDDANEYIIDDSIIPLVQEKITTSELNSVELLNFGASISMTPDGKMFVSADSGNSIVYIYKWNGQNWDYTYIQSNKPNIQFGRDVAISASGTKIAISSYERINYNYYGVIYVYNWDGKQWIETNKISSENYATIADQFGSSIALASDGNTLVVAAAPNNIWTQDEGAVFVFRYQNNTWVGTELEKDTRIFAGDAFGSSIDISADGNTIVVGSPGTDYEITEFGGGQQSRDNRGAIYIYTWDGSKWKWIYKTITHSQYFVEWIGSSVSISDDGKTILTGTPHAIIDTVSDKNWAGAVYVYNLIQNEWSVQRINDADGSDSKWFGSNVSISPDGSAMLVASGSDDNDRSVRLFRKIHDDWIEFNRFDYVFTDIANNVYYGDTALEVSLNGELVIIGAPSDITGTGDNKKIGSVFIY